MSAALHSTSPTTSLSHVATASTGTLPASSVMPAVFILASPAGSLSRAVTAITSTSTASLATSAALRIGLSPATCLFSAGMMPFGLQLADEHFNFDFPGLSTDKLTNDGVTMSINTSNREDFAFDGGFNGGSSVAGDPSPSFAYNPASSMPSVMSMHIPIPSGRLRPRSGYSHLLRPLRPNQLPLRPASSVDAQPLGFSAMKVF
ncbi:hypothetical protein B0H14DRAFT_3485747 [Mycena olivaceomarginata]|nr:hypothetical protein B0H14DRAFT_3485747 [Mycena olivaceomarginata]